MKMLFLENLYKFYNNTSKIEFPKIELSPKMLENLKKNGKEWEILV